MPPASMSHVSDAPARLRRWPAAGVLAVLVLGTCLVLWGLGSQDRVSSDRYDVRSAPLGDEGIEQHASWVVGMLNGDRVTASEVEARLSAPFLAQLNPQQFLLETAGLVQNGPYEQRGFDLEVDGPVQVLRSALQDGDGEVVDFTIAVNSFVPDEIQGMTLLVGDSARGPFSPIDALAHLLASWVLGVAGVLLWVKADRAAAGKLLAVAGILWLAQFLELTDAPFLYTAGLIAGPVAAFIAVVALVRLDRRSVDGAAVLVMILAAAAAAASVSTLLAIDTSVAELPDQLLSITHNRDAARGLAVAEQTGAVVAAVALAALFWWRYFSNRLSPSSRHQSRALVASIVAGIVIFVAVWGLRGDHHDLSQSPIISLAAMVIPAGIGFQTVREDNERLRGLVVSELRSSRSRILDSAEQARRDIERDLHDGAQQRLMALQVSLKLEQQRAERAGEQVDPAFLASVGDELGGAIEELRELGRGLRPSALDHGLRAAVESLAERSPLPMVTDIDETRAPSAIESAAYFVINEAVANATRHSGADHVRVTTTAAADHLYLEVVDNGIGGATNGTGNGAGMQSLEDRVVALDGTLTIESPPAEGTRVMVSLPFTRGSERHG